MRPLIAAVALAMVVATGACWFPDKGLTPSDASPPPPDAPPPPPDAPPGPYDCHDQPLPVIAPNQVTIAGTVNDIYTRDPTAGASIDAIEVSSGGHLWPAGTVKTKADGSFSGVEGTPGLPVNEYLIITPSGPPRPPATMYYPTYYYPAVPVAGNLDLTEDIQLVSDYGGGQLLAALFSANEMPDLTNKGVITVSVTNCNGIPVGGAVVTTSIPTSVGSVVKYLGANGIPSKTATATDSTYGLAMIFNVPEDTIVISATIPAMGMRLRPNAVPGKKASIVETAIQP
jgi:hypothetical protein